MPINILELVSKIEKLIVKKANIEYKPLPLGDVSQTYADISKAKALLNYQPATGIE